jgi:hypothetical protein
LSTPGYFQILPCSSTQEHSTSGTVNTTAKVRLLRIAAGTEFRLALDEPLAAAERSCLPQIKIPTKLSLLMRHSPARNLIGDPVMPSSSFSLSLEVHYSVLRQRTLAVRRDRSGAMQLQDFSSTT